MPSSDLPASPPPLILNVDDNDAIRYARSKTLTQAGYRLVEASSAKEALLMAAALSPRLILLDVNLPGIDGFEVCRRIKADHDTSRIMVLQVSSARSSKMDVVAGLEGGADGYLIEPIDPLELVATVRALLRLADREAENLRLIRRLSRSERQFVEATEAADCGLWDWDIPGGRLEWFGAHERLAGMSPGSFSGKIEVFSQILHADDCERVWRKLQESMARQDEQYADEYRFVHPDGSVHWMAGVGRFFYDEGGQAVRMTGVVQDISLRKHAEEGLRIKAERSRLLARAAEQLLTSDDPSGLMTGVFETVRHHLELEGFFLYRVEESRSALRLEACAGVADHLVPECQHLDFGQALCGTAAALRLPMVRERLQDSQDEAAQIIKSLGFRAYACHPLLVGERLLGTLSFASKGRDRFTSNEIEFMATICRYVAAAMERLRLQQETAEQVRQLAKSEDALRASEGRLARQKEALELAVSGASAHEVFNVIVRALRDQAGDDARAALFMVDAEASRLRFCASAGMSEGYTSAVDGFEIREDNPSCGSVAYTGRAMMVRDVEEDPLWAPYLDLTRAHGIRACFSFPILSVGGKVLGTLAVYYSTPRDADPRTVEMIGLLTRTAAVIIEWQREAEERTGAEEALRESEERLRLALDGADMGSWDVDLRTGTTMWNRRHAEIQGYAEGSHSIAQWQDRVHPDDLERVMAAVDRAKRDRTLFAVEHRVHLPQPGHVRWLSLYGRFTYDAAGEPVRFSGVSLDITERKQAEQALEAMAREAGRRAQEAEESRRLLIALMEYIPEGITIADAPDVTIRYVSKYGRTLLQREERDIANIPVQEHAQQWGILRADDGTPARNEDLPLTRSTQRGEVVIDEEWVLRRPDGSLISLLCNAGPIRDTDGRITGGVIVWRDITARQRAELMLRLERERLALALEVGQMGVYELDMVEDRLWWSPETYRVFGVSPDAFTPTRDTFTALLHPDDRDGLWRRLAETIGMQQEFVHEFRIVRPDGAVRWIGNRAQTVCNAAGQPIRHYGVAVDMTDRKQIEEQLIRSRDAFFHVMQDAPFGVYVIDRDFRIRQVNAGSQAVFANVRPLIGRDFAEALRIIWPEPFASEAIGHFRHTLATGQSYVAPSLTQRRQDSGEIESYEWQIHRIMLPDGEPGVVCYFYESTDIRRAEEALAQRERELRIITDSVPSLISYVDARETYRFVNAGYEQMFGRPRSEIAGRTVAELLGAGYENVKPYIDRVLAGEAVRFETQIVYDGRLTTVLASYTPDRRDDGSVDGFYVLATDITERKRQEEELRRWKDELELRVQERTQELVDSQERLRELASQLTMAEQRERQKLARDLHDYLAQLMAVGQMKTGLLKKLPDLPPKGQDMAQDIGNVFQQALTYTRTLIGQLSPPSFREYGLPAALQWLSERMQKDGLWVEVQSDRQQVPLSEERAVPVFQCVRELLFNVLKHAGVDRATVRVAVDDQGDVRVAVEDRGKGLDPDALRRAAEPGHLGLFAVRERMEAIAGRVEFASPDGSGTVVTLVIPKSAREG